MLPYASFVTNDIYCLCMFTEYPKEKIMFFLHKLLKFLWHVPLCFIWKIMYHIKRNWLRFNCPQRTSINKKWSTMIKCYTIWLCSDYYYLFFAYLPVDVIFCMWRISHFSCILKPLYFNKSCSVHKRKPQVYNNLGMVGKNLRWL